MNRITSALFVFLFLITTISKALDDQVPRKVGIFIFKDVQIIDYTGPYEVFFNANEGGRREFEVFTIGKTRDTVRTIGGMLVMPTYSFLNHPKLDVVVIPGGWGVYEQRKDSAVIKWIQNVSAQAEVVLSVCNGAFFLAKAGLLDGLSATTNAGAIPRLQQEVPGCKVIDDKRFVDNGKIVTSAGLSAGIDASLYVIKKLSGEAWAKKVSTIIEYDWRPESHYARAKLADGYVPPAGVIFQGAVCKPITYDGGTDRWESKTLVMSSLSAGQALEQVENIVQKMMNWSKNQKSSQGLTSVWMFKGHDGKNWKGVITADSAGTNEGIMLTIRVNRM